MYIVHITNGMVNSVPTRQIFRPVVVTVASFSFASVLPASRDLPSSSTRSTVGLPLMWSKISSAVVLGSPALEQFRVGRLPPSDDSLVGPLACHFVGSRLQSCLLTENCCRP